MDKEEAKELLEEYGLVAGGILLVCLLPFGLGYIAIKLGYLPNQGDIFSQWFAGVMVVIVVIFFFYILKVLFYFFYALYVLIRESIKKD